MQNEAGRPQEVFPGSREPSADGSKELVDEIPNGSSKKKPLAYPAPGNERVVGGPEEAKRAEKEVGEDVGRPNNDREEDHRSISGSA